MPFRSFLATTATQEVAGYNPKRKTLSLANNGAATAFFSSDAANVATAGFPLAPGAAVSLTKDDGDEPEAALFIVASAGSIDIRVQESVGDVKA